VAYRVPVLNYDQYVSNLAQYSCPPFRRFQRQGYSLTNGTLFQVSAFRNCIGVDDRSCRGGIADKKGIPLNNPENRCATRVFEADNGGKQAPNGAFSVESLETRKCRPMRGKLRGMEPRRSVKQGKGDPTGGAGPGISGTSRSRKIGYREEFLGSHASGVPGFGREGSSPDVWLGRTERSGDTCPV
jgi:hypothetical protein